MSSDMNKSRLFSKQLTQLDDEHLGRVVRAGFSGLNDGIRLTTIAAQLLISETESMNGDRASFTINRYTRIGVELGDWQVKVIRLNKRRKFFRFMGKIKEWFCDLGARKVPMTDIFDPNTKISSLTIIDNDPFRKGNKDA